MASKDNKDFLIKEDGTIVRSVISSSKVEIFKKKISKTHEEVDNDYVDDDDDEVTICLECYSGDVIDDGSGILQYSCTNCGNIWGSRYDVKCPVCGSNDVTDDGSNCLQYKCNDCGHIWGDEENNDDEYENETFCPDCGSDDITDDGSNYLQYECNDCGHIWGDEEDK